MNKARFYLIYLVLIMTAVFVSFHRDVQVPVAKPLAEIPLRVANWTQVDDVYFSEAVLDQLRPTDYLYRVYVNDDKQLVTLYVGYHGGGPNSGPIHSPKHCLPGSGWQAVSEKSKALTIDGDEVQLVEAVYQHGDRREIFWYWYQVKGESLTNEYALKFAEILNSIRYRRRDSAFIRISSIFQGADHVSSSAVEQFVRDFYPKIKAVLPQ
ncbi:exosortase C-terminal domain/associated protein EpsI [uncultured Desulfuromonas sp.]|uniref:exosortase C-terminal domain/associated protein EpsI n=1 Tax=uncultured Desulfuromonas sp. TaxID=181013 RepID=UPI002AAAD1F4|nr:exosortase C-terminal domain/associated protein EpsI [uncultured Desulfuromonas sp.]